MRAFRPAADGHGDPALRIREEQRLRRVDIQPFLRFGVRTDAQSRPSIGGRTVENLYACGELLAGVSAVYGKERIRESAEKVIALLKATDHAEA